MTPQQQAQAWLDQNTLILDTETTGLGEDAEICEIAVIDCQGNVLLDTLVRTRWPIPRDASAIHGIHNSMCLEAGDWSGKDSAFRKLCEGRPVVIYNADYDTRILNQTANLYDLGPIVLDAQCAMLAYAEFHGRWDHRREQWKWQKLTNAAAQMGVQIEGQAHRALADCRMTLGIIQAMASAAQKAG